jgi:hypothetical protein
MRKCRPFFGPTHPLAEVAERNCQTCNGELIGNVACGACWERAIRDDERVVVEHGLPRRIEPDPQYVDEIAVELACGGERVALSPLELRMAARTLAGRRMSRVEIARRLHTTHGVVTSVLSEVTTRSTEMAA